MRKSGPNPLSPYCYDNTPIPVETVGTVIEKQWEQTIDYEKKNDKVDSDQEDEIQKNKKDIADVNVALANKADKSEIPSVDNFYTKAEVDAALSGKADKSEIPSLEDYYTKSEVDAMILQKENEIYDLMKIVGDLGGAVTYTIPNDAGKSLNSIMSNYSGTVKLTEDTTITRVCPGVIAKNNIKLNLNGKTLTSTSAGSAGAIQARGSQVVTIGGNGAIEAGDGICIEANGANVVINLTGSTTQYHNNRDAELIYCYLGTINISGGVFRDDTTNNYILNCYDANYKNGTAKIVVTGGKFYNFNPADNLAEGPGTNFVAEGYTVVESQEGDNVVYTVKKA